MPACYFGIVLGRQSGLGVNQLDALFAHRPDAWQTLKRDLVVATVLGFLVGATLLTLRLFTTSVLPPELPQLGFRGVLGGLAVSLGAAVAGTPFGNVLVGTFFGWMFWQRGILARWSHIFLLILCCMSSRSRYGDETLCSACLHAPCVRMFCRFNRGVTDRD